jgi:hypothetical protein
LTKAHVAGLDEVDGPTIERMAARLPRGKWDRPEWPWPEPALTYDNARLPEALMAAGEALEDPSMETDGLRLLEWLVGVETGAYGFSFTPVGGRRLGDPQPAFDQQPLEAWGMADATMRAHALTGDGRWSDLAELALAWFFGANDTGDSLYDPVSGAGFDGLTADGPNLNRGAESTLAALGTILGVRRSLPEAVAATPL